MLKKYLTMNTYWQNKLVLYQQLVIPDFLTFEYLVCNLHKYSLPLLLFVNHSTG